MNLFTSVPKEMNYEILFQLNDDELANFCQSDKNIQQLCMKHPRLKNRIKKYNQGMINIQQILDTVKIKINIVFPYNTKFDVDDLIFDNMYHVDLYAFHISYEMYQNIYEIYKSIEMIVSKLGYVFDPNLIKRKKFFDYDIYYQILSITS